jgi:hypothetical protein
VPIDRVRGRDLAPALVSERSFDKVGVLPGHGFTPASGISGLPAPFGDRSEIDLTLRSM